TALGAASATAEPPGGGGGKGHKAAGLEISLLPAGSEAGAPVRNEPTMVSTAASQIVQNLVGLQIGPSNSMGTRSKSGATATAFVASSNSPASVFTFAATAQPGSAGTEVVAIQELQPMLDGNQSEQAGHNVPEVLPMPAAVSGNLMQGSGAMRWVSKWHG